MRQEEVARQPASRLPVPEALQMPAAGGMVEHETARNSLLHDGTIGAPGAFGTGEEGSLGYGGTR
ncbi:hypothetical protein Aab01nite_78550 [Paractinoplanes abujensis]|nr:hypothetical protein Aab01nite_78550 [Actinoplanes abujensis]